jgi:crotonobetainyl-CoA:carnitine CoA-transferase CaiB-like acyl-CoA transferase
VGAVIEIVVAACAMPMADSANAAVNQRRKNAAAADSAPHSGRPTSDEVVVMG